MLIHVPEFDPDVKKVFAKGGTITVRTDRLKRPIDVVIQIGNGATML